MFLYWGIKYIALTWIYKIEYRKANLNTNVPADTWWVKSTGFCRKMFSHHFSVVFSLIVKRSYSKFLRTCRNFKKKKKRSDSTHKSRSTSSQGDVRLTWMLDLGNIKLKYYSNLLLEYLIKRYIFVLTLLNKTLLKIWILF